MYKLQTIQLHQTNRELTCVNIFLCDDVSLMTRDEMTRLVILISQVKPFRESETWPTSTSHLRSSERHCLGATIISNSSRNPLLERHRFITRWYSRQGVQSLSQLMFRDSEHPCDVFVLESILPWRGWLPFF